MQRFDRLYGSKYCQKLHVNQNVALSRKRIKVPCRLLLATYDFAVR